MGGLEGEKNPRLKETNTWRMHLVKSGRGVTTRGGPDLTGLANTP